jgi:oxepin-CoA hydrolase/3-oxo-5,6-dehydrosuberyl-CoA semialdehyde dehydrogenase
MLRPDKSPKTPTHPRVGCGAGKTRPGLDPGLVRFTVKASSSHLSGMKVDQEKRTPKDVAKGIVKFLVDVFDETGETVAIATILTMVKKLDQN